MRFGARRAVLTAAALTISAVGSAPAIAGATTTTAKNVNVVNQGGSCTSAFCFKPQRVKGPAGQVVTWNNMTAATHTIVRCTPAACSGRGPGTGTTRGFGDGNFLPGATYSFTFKNAGTYFYYCSVHGYSVMHGSVTVT